MKMSLGSAAGSILLDRLRLPSKFLRQKAVDVRRGQQGAGKKMVIYSTPCLGLAACPRYAPFSVTASVESAGNKNGPWIQIVLECRVRPGSYKVQSTSPAKADWDKDLRVRAKSAHY